MNEVYDELNCQFFKVVERALLSFEEVSNFICEIVMVLNNNPFVYNSEDDLHEALTPFHLMYGRDSSNSETFCVWTTLIDMNIYSTFRIDTGIVS